MNPLIPAQRTGPDTWREFAPAPADLVIPEFNPLGRGLLIGLLLSATIWIPLIVLIAGWL